MAYVPGRNLNYTQLVAQNRLIADRLDVTNAMLQVLGDVVHNCWWCRLKLRVTTWRKKWNSSRR